MPLLQVRDFPSDIYEEIKAKAKQEHRTISQQTIVLIKDSLERNSSDKDRRLKVLERIKNRAVPVEVKKIDPVEWIREDRNR